MKLMFVVLCNFADKKVKRAAFIEYLKQQISELIPNDTPGFLYTCLSAQE